jgi:Big-like domain-containing protein/PQQ enzyme-like repeat protein/putative pyrroloquinoline-quinone-binding quinoprotein
MNAPPRHSSFRVLPALLSVLLLLAGPVVAYDWPQFGGSAAHSGSNASETAINRSNVNALSPRYQIGLPAAVDGTPVFLEGVPTAGGTKDLLFVTTTAGHIVALDAANGSQLWAHQYGPGSCRINNGSSACYTTSSPAIDPNRQFVYSYGLDGFAHKYRVGDGVEITTGGWPELATTKGFDEKGSSALAIATSNATSYLYVSHGGYPGDQGDYQGHITAINLATGAQKVFNTACSDQPVHFQSTTVNGATPTCATRQDAIWSRPGVVYDAGTDRILMGTGNAFSPNLGQFDGNHNWSESVIALHPDATGGAGANAGRPLDSYTPTEHLSLDNADADVGSTAPAILPVPANSRVQHLAMQSGKDAKIRLLDLANLSGQGGPGHTAGEAAAVINVPQGGGVLSQPAVWINPADDSTWVFIVNGNGASALRLAIDGSGNPSLVAQWAIGQGGTSPIVASAILFYIDGGTVRAVDPVSGAQLWSVANPGGTHWQSLIVANGSLYATDGAAHLTAFSPPQGPTPTTSVLSSNPNPADAGASVTFTATVTGSNPTGSVNFRDAGASITGCAAVTISGTGNVRSATCSTSTLATGNHPIVADYSGDAANAASSSSPLSQVIATTSFSNGGFEAPSLGGNYQYNPSGATWVFTGAAGITGNANPFTNGNPAAPEGIQVAFLQGAGSAASQSAHVDPGQYMLILQAAQRGNFQNGVQVVRVQVDGVTVGQYQPPGTNYTSYQTPMFAIASGGTHTIALVGVGTGGDFTAFVDNVRLTSVVSSGLANGGFETPGLNGSYQYNPTGATWTFTGGAGISGNANAFTFGNPSAPEGVQAAFLQGGGSLAQATSIGAGQYILNFLAAQRGNFQFGSQIILVQVDSVTVGQFQPQGTIYSAYQTPVFSVASSGTHTVTLSGVGSGSDFTAFVDNITLAPAGSNFVINGGFETPDLSGGYQYGPNGATWAFADGGGITGNANAFTAGNPVAPEGAQAAFLQGAGIATQSANIPAGQYMLSFQGAQRGNLQLGIQTIRVQVDGVTIGQFQPPGTSYSNYQTSAFTVAASGSHAISLAGVGSGTDFTAFVDDVKVIATP